MNHLPTRAPRPLRVAALAACLCAPLALRAQAPFSATLVVANPSPYLTQWQGDPTVALLMLTNATQQDIPVQTSARIMRGQSAVASFPGLISVVPGAPATSVYRTPQIARWGAGSFAPGAAASLREGGALPEGAYTLCVDFILSGGSQLVETCVPFTIALSTPPRLVAPLDRTDIVTRFPVLQWTPASGARTPIVTYTLRVVELYGGQSPTRAVEANRPVFESIVTSLTALQYPLAAWPLQPGRCYAWRVQARGGQPGNGALAGAPVGRNEGRSEVFTFCYRPPGDRLDSLRQRADTSRRDSVGDILRDSLPTRSAPRTPPPGWRASSRLALPWGAVDTTGAAPGGFTGSTTVYGEAYARDGSGPATRPGDTERLRLTGLYTGAGWTAPVELLLASDERTNRQRISQLRVSPTWRALTVHGGMLVPQFSEYSLYDATLLGGGAELRPASSPLSASAWVGESQRAVRPDDPTLLPQYARTLAAASAGYGTADRTNLRADVLWAADRRNSLGTLGDTTGATSPQRNLVAGLRGQLPLWRDRVLASAAVSRSIYRRDLRASGGTDLSDDAGHLSLAYRMPTWSLGTTVAYVGANYVSLGNTQLVTDRIDYQLAGAFQRATVNGSATAGIRRNNVDDALDATTRTRGIYSLALGWAPTAIFGIDVGASNTVIDARGHDTTFSRNGTTVLSLTPRLGWRRGTASHQLVLTGGYQLSDNEALADPQPANVASTSGTLTYALTFDRGLGVDLTASTARTTTAGTAMTIAGLTPGIGYALPMPLLPRPLQARGALQWTSSALGGIHERELLPMLQLGYSVADGHTLALDLRRRSYRPRGGAAGRFDELTAMLEYTRPF